MGAGILNPRGGKGACAVLRNPILVNALSNWAWAPPPTYGIPYVDGARYRADVFLFWFFTRGGGA